MQNPAYSVRHIVDSVVQTEGFLCREIMILTVQKNAPTLNVFAPLDYNIRC